MPNPPKKRALGRGLSALISSANVGSVSENSSAEGPPRDREYQPRETNLQTIEPLSDGSILIELDPQSIGQNPRQPRKHFDEDALQELAQSIRLDGVLEPVIVRKTQYGAYELVSGERRVKASILADRETIPAVVRNVDDREMLKIGLIENIQREDLNPIETAQAYRALIEDFDWTQEQLAEQVGKNRSTITNTLRLLNLEPEIQQAVLDGRISMGHAKALLAIDSPSRQSAACRKIIDDGLSVRQAEKLSAPQELKPKAPPTPDTAPKNPHLSQIEDRLRRIFGTKVIVRANEHHAGKIEIEFYDLDQLDRILTHLEKRP